MYIDETIKINVKILPQILKDDIEFLEQKNKEGAWFDYDVYLEGFGASVKQCAIDNLISEKMRDDLLWKYRWNKE